MWVCLFTIQVILVLIKQYWTIFVKEKCSDNMGIIRSHSFFHNYYTKAA